ncbi:transmembrane protein 154-like isoform X2 [Anguilla anguilla]|uniref:transmembrane protein 154-like isoform X2 n=1 Tax=Anguilla anguilla TaxID=7936 RepID=UPI0015AF2A87|nr:transmembrane protein 154-like isoform X2 [Anguilla anguilla]
MSSLLLAGLLVVFLAGRCTVLADVTEKPVLQENPDVNTKTPEESLPTEEYPEDDDDNETDSTDSPNNESSGDGEAGNATRPDTRLNRACDTDLHDVEKPAECKAGLAHSVIIPIVLVTLLIVVVVIVVIFLCRRRKKKTIPCDVKEEEALAACDAGTLPIPMFDDDIPSVLELEMEDLQKLDGKTDSLAAGETASASGMES